MPFLYQRGVGKNANLELGIAAETPPLFLRLTCRSAVWRGDAGKTLERLSSKRIASNPDYLRPSRLVRFWLPTGTLG